MPVAPLPEVRRVLEYAVTEIPPEKIFMGLPNYGYVWREPYVAGQSRAQSIGNQEAVLIAARQGVPIEYDQRAQSPFFRFRRSGALHQVWFEDVRSMEQKFLLCDELALLGGGYWNLMRPFAQNWALLSARYYMKKLGLC